MRHLDLFSGIGGFALAARRVGWETTQFVEIESYCQKVLAKNFPGVPIHDDIQTYTAARGAFDIITGGFPCQDISHAGKQTGIEGDRSGLWGELCRITGEVGPRFAVYENVAALLSGDRGRWFQRVLGDLAEIGYDCEWHCIPASAVGAPHRRDRVWIIAYPKRNQLRQQPRRLNGQNRKGQAKPTDDGETQPVADTDEPRLERWLREVMRERTGERSVGQSSDPWDGNWFAEPAVGRVANGIPRRVDRLRGLGNAIVPQVAEVIFRAIDSNPL